MNLKISIIIISRDRNKCNTRRKIRQIRKQNTKTTRKDTEMSISKRQMQILALLDENEFMSVERLSHLTYTSPSSIRRDLTKLQNLSLIRRTHGGIVILVNAVQ